MAREETEENIEMDNSMVTGEGGGQGGWEGAWNQVTACNGPMIGHRFKRLPGRSGIQAVGRWSPRAEISPRGQ